MSNQKPLCTLVGCGFPRAMIFGKHRYRFGQHVEWERAVYTGRIWGIISGAVNFGKTTFWTTRQMRNSQKPVRCGIIYWTNNLEKLQVLFWTTRQMRKGKLVGFRILFWWIVWIFRYMFSQHVKREMAIQTSWVWDHFLGEWFWKLLGTVLNNTSNERGPYTPVRFGLISGTNIFENLQVILWTTRHLSKGLQTGWGEPFWETISTF